MDISKLKNADILTQEGLDLFFAYMNQPTQQGFSTHAVLVDKALREFWSLSPEARDALRDRTT